VRVHEAAGGSEVGGCSISVEDTLCSIPHGSDTDFAETPHCPVLHPWLI
jgi:hypothetical protein